MINAVIFDSDGMLTHGPRFSDTYAKDHAISIDEMTPFFTGPFKDCLIGKADIKEELRKEWLQKWKWHGSADELLNYWFSIGDQIDADVFNTVQLLRESGIICILATNQEKYRTDYLSNKFGYNERFDKVFSSAYIGSKKPSFEFFDRIMSFLNQRVKTEKTDVLFWDDDIENIDGARAYGVNVRQFTNTQNYLSEMRKLKLL